MHPLGHACAPGHAKFSSVRLMPSPVLRGIAASEICLQSCYLMPVRAMPRVLSCLRTVVQFCTVSAMKHGIALSGMAS